ncbi:MAG: hypothetical protein R6U63_03680 [Longimicrobiales bacterium]
MSTVVGIAVLVGLFLAFPFIQRERDHRECGSGGCWKKKIGFGCGTCPLDESETGAGSGSDHTSV